MRRCRIAVAAAAMVVVGLVSAAGAVAAEDTADQSLPTSPVGHLDLLDVGPVTDVTVSA